MVTREGMIMRRDVSLLAVLFTAPVMAASLEVSAAGGEARMLVAPFTQEEAVDSQREWSGTLGTQVEVTNSIGMKLVLIPPGEFLMGSPEGEERRSRIEHRHRVRITKPFYLGVYEVSQKEYQQVMGTNPSWHQVKDLEGKLKDLEESESDLKDDLKDLAEPEKKVDESKRELEDLEVRVNALADELRDLADRARDLAEEAGGLDRTRFPVECVSWEDAADFCRKLSSLPSEKVAHWVYRLPTEAEWEYACRAGTTTPFHFGSQSNGREANCLGRFPYGTTVKGPYLGRATIVGSYAPNAFGLYDMHGNVFEWCRDWLSFNYYRASPIDDPQGPSWGWFRVIRGGGWESSGHCRSAYRHWALPSSRGSARGFRVAAFPPGT
jgi:formylglycine-generating enzyme required for sulfatase activity